MTTFAQVIEAAIPDAAADVIDHVMWGRTPYPFGKVTARALYKAASGWRRARDHKINLCDHCDNLALPGKWECQRCSDALSKARVA